MEEMEDETIFPRYKQKSDIPASYVKFMPENNDALNLDTMYPTLQKWIFNPRTVRSVTNDDDTDINDNGDDGGDGDNDGDGGDDSDDDRFYHSTSSVVHLFQPGKKHIFGSMEKDRMGCRSMMHLPVKPGNLDTWLQCFEAGSKIKPKTSRLHDHDYLCYSWQSVVLLPRSQVTEKLRNKHRTEESGFVDAIEVSDVYNDIVTKAFPKIAALAGLKKDKVVPKGWISFTRRDKICKLVICTGSSLSNKSTASDGTAFEGVGQYEPVDQPLFQISGGIVNQITGLHDLFCTVEGLLRTL